MFSSKRRRILVLAGSIWLIACATNRGPTPQLKAQPDTRLAVMPFSRPEIEGSANDAGRRGLLGVLVDSQTGLYTYKFEDEDFEYLRQLLIQSLQSQGAYDEIVDATDSASAGEQKIVRLRVDFLETGLKEGGGGFVCTLKARVALTDSADAMITARDVSVEEYSPWSVGSAKSRASEGFVHEILGFLASVS